MEFSEAKDFANSIQLVKTEEPVTAAEEPDTMDTKMEEVEEKPPAPAPLPPPPPRAATEPRYCAPLSLFLCQTSFATTSCLPPGICWSP